MTRKWLPNERSTMVRPQQCFWLALRKRHVRTAAALRCNKQPCGIKISCMCFCTEVKHVALLLLKAPVGNIEMGALANANAPALSTAAFYHHVG